MKHKKENPVALAGANREETVKTMHTVLDSSSNTENQRPFQEIYVSRKYGLSPCMARVVCQLANIGGGMA